MVPLSFLLLALPLSTHLRPDLRPDQEIFDKILYQTKKVQKLFTDLPPGIWQKSPCCTSCSLGAWPTAHTHGRSRGTIELRSTQQALDRRRKEMSTVAAPDGGARELAEARVGDPVPAKTDVAGGDERDAGSPARLKIDVDNDVADKEAKTGYRETVRKRLGDEEHAAISQILSLQQEQFEQQVRELHILAQREWSQVSQALFPYLESFRPVASGGALNPTAASAILAAAANGDPQHAALNQAVAEMNTMAQAGQAWWQDPAKVMGMKVMPSLVHQASVSNHSSQMDSTMIVSPHLSQLFSQQQQQGGQPSDAAAAIVGRHQMAGPVGARSLGDARQAPDAGIAPIQSQGHHQNADGSSSAAARRVADGHAKVAAPKPKVATPQSAIDILLALSEARRGDAKEATPPRSEARQAPREAKAVAASAAAAGAAALETMVVHGTPRDRGQVAASADQN